MKFYEVTSQFILTRHVIAYDMLTVSKKTWDGLSAATRAKFRSELAQAHPGTGENRLSSQDSRCWDEEVDLLVIGAGAAGMMAALIASLEGLHVVLCEKTTMVGGITSTSGGTTWVPGTSQSVRAGVPDTRENAAGYLDSVVPTPDGADLRAAFLEAGPRVIDDLETRTEVKFVAMQAHPDYLGNHNGAAYGGRALAPEPFDGRLLGNDFARVRPPRDEFMVLGGMMVARTELTPLLKPFASLSNLRTVLGLLVRQLTDRLRYPRGTRLVMGNALVARLLFSLRQRNVPILFETALVDLVRNDRSIAGAVLEGPLGRRAVRARKGVVLATGGIARSPELRARLFPSSAAYSLAPDGNTGDGVTIAVRAGAALDDGGASPALWMPTSILRRPDGSLSLWPHIMLDRAKPGLIAVNSAGRRFVNEADSYHDFVMGMLRSNRTVPSIPAYLICDDRFLVDYGMGLVFPGARSRDRLIAAGYLVQADTLKGLAAKIGVEADGLERTVADHNRSAKTGVDEDFGKGSTPMNRFNGDPANGPNPCLRALETAPFYAVAVWPADLASSAGLKVDTDARVLDGEGRPIRNLYACGNDMRSIFAGTYPGPGTTLGPALVFGWRVAQHAAHGHADITNTTQPNL